MRDDVPQGTSAPKIWSKFIKGTPWAEAEERWDDVTVK
jgi:hypothetical protein